MTTRLSTPDIVCWPRPPHSLGAAATCYLLRPPFALDAVERTADGQVRVHFKKASRNGTTYAQMTPERFLARLCSLVPPLGAHTVRYYGVLAPRHALRARIIPTADVQRSEPKQLSPFVPQGHLERAAITKPALQQQQVDAAPYRLPWMSLLARVFRIQPDRQQVLTIEGEVEEAGEVVEELVAEVLGLVYDEDRDDAVPTSEFADLAFELAP